MYMKTIQKVVKPTLVYACDWSRSKQKAACSRKLIRFRLVKLFFSQIRTNI